MKIGNIIIGDCQNAALLKDLVAAYNTLLQDFVNINAKLDRSDRKLDLIIKQGESIIMDGKQQSDRLNAALDTLASEFQAALDKEGAEIIAQVKQIKVSGGMTDADVTSLEARILNFASNASAKIDTLSETDGAGTVQPPTPPATPAP